MAGWEFLLPDEACQRPAVELSCGAGVRQAAEGDFGQWQQCSWLGSCSKKRLHPQVQLVEGESHLAGLLSTSMSSSLGLPHLSTFMEGCMAWQLPGSFVVYRYQQEVGTSLSTDPQVASFQYWQTIWQSVRVWQAHQSLQRSFTPPEQKGTSTLSFARLYTLALQTGRFQTSCCSPLSTGNLGTIQSASTWP